MIIKESRIKSGGRFSRITAKSQLDRTLPSAISAPFTERRIKLYAFNNESSPALNRAISLDRPQVDDFATVFIAAGTQRDTTADLSPARYYCTGTLNAEALTGSSSLTVDFPSGSGALTYLVANDLLLLQQPLVAGVRADDSMEHIRLASFTKVGDSASIQLSSLLTKDWAIGTTVGVCLTAQSISASVSGIIKTGLTFNESQIYVTNNSAAEQTVTLTLTTGTAFSATTDDSSIALTGGSINSQYAPLNPATGEAYFSIPPTAWLSVSAGNSLQFTTSPSAVPLWVFIRYYDGHAVNDSDDHAASLRITAFNENLE